MNNNIKNPNLKYLQSLIPNNKEIIYLHYIFDPMCSWCWCFNPRLDELIKLIDVFNKQETNKHIQINYLCGGLAKDTNKVMSPLQQEQIQSYWQTIHKLYKTEFNFDFWAPHQNTPRRATYMSNRAVLTAFKLKNTPDFISLKQMILTIQKAYYLRALNPSEVNILVKLATELAYQKDKFKELLLSQEIDDLFNKHLRFVRFMGVNSFPSICMEQNNKMFNIVINYQDANYIFENIKNKIF
jgi:putative protein-disulfide isomerase